MLLCFCSANFVAFSCSSVGYVFYVICYVVAYEIGRGYMFVTYFTVVGFRNPKGSGSFNLKGSGYLHIGLIPRSQFLRVFAVVFGDMIFSIQ